MRCSAHTICLRTSLWNRHNITSSYGSKGSSAVGVRTIYDNSRIRNKVPQASSYGSKGSSAVGVRTLSANSRMGFVCNSQFYFCSFISFVYKNFCKKPLLSIPRLGLKPVPYGTTTPNCELQGLIQCLSPEYRHQIDLATTAASEVWVYRCSHDTTPCTRLGSKPSRCVITHGQLDVLCI